MELYVESQTIDYTILNTKGDASTSTSFNLFPKFYDAYPLSLQARVKTAFEGTVTTPTVKVGNTDDDNCYIQEQKIDAAGDLLPGMGTNYQGYCSKMIMESRKTFGASSQGVIMATFTSSSGNFGALTAGEIEFVYIYAK